MKKYLLSSTVIHFVGLLVVLFSPLFNSTPKLLLIDGFEFLGDGGGGGGSGGGPSGGMKEEKMGQVVPQPIKVPIPEKAAPVQKAIRGEETWAVKKDNKKIEIKKNMNADETIEKGDEVKEAKTNIIRRGTSVNEKAGQGGFDFGQGGGDGSGSGGGSGRGIGIGVGDGTGAGFGFGSYLKVLRSRVWSEWTQSALFGSKDSCIIGFTVKRSGDIEDIKVEKSSGNANYDSVALRAVRNSSPLPALPSGFQKPEQRFRVQFRLTE
ncbi:MAG: energy transducer TonB [Elusimicrobiota bacterium]